MMLTHGQGDSKESGDICHHLLSLIIMLANGLEAPASDASDKAHSTYTRVKAHIQKHYLRHFTLEDIARDVHVNSAYLCRLFKRFGSHSPYEFLMRQKMAKARELLVASGEW